MKIKSRLTKNELTTEQEIQLFRLFASWSKKRKYEYIKKLPKERAFRLKYTWRAWARDSQLAPDGDWSTWVLMSGRGFGKTRTGAEWIIEKAERYPGCHIALVGRTVADVRDVMIRGRSGILSVSPPWFKPIYTPSKRLLVWPNGSYATTYSADVPDQLRGPQHSFAWGDERCFIAGTLIRTSKGLCPIEKIQPGDLVYTREGLKRVKHAGLTNPSTTVYDLTTSDGRVLVGTGNHPIWVQDKGFKPLHSLSSGDILMVWEQMKLDTASSGVENDGGSMGAITATEKVNSFTEPSIQRHTGQSHQECISTIKTLTKQTMTLPIWKQSRLRNILRVIRQRDGGFGKSSNAKKPHGSTGQRKNHTTQIVSIVERSLQLQALLLSSVPLLAERHIDAKILHRLFLCPVYDVATPSWFTEQGCATVRRGVHMRIGQRNNPSNAQFVTKSSLQMIRERSAAQENVGLSTRAEVRRGHGCALIVRGFSTLRIHHQKRCFAQDHVETSIGTKTSLNNNVHVIQIKQRAEKMAVFNLEVEDCHEYFANDILVHNCSWQYDDAWDQLQFGLRIEASPGVPPQAVVTTTPRNTKAMKDLVKDPSTVVTKRSTYENRENLSPKFIREIERHYGGTRLGRQEIEGEIIDDIDGALWKRDWIERNRVIKHPELKRIVVAIDPPATSAETSEDPAEAGIVVSGIGVDGHGYMLADYSMVGTPDEWASAALTAYNIFEADCIVGEINNGGDMIEAVIRSKAKEKGMKQVSFKSVRATRGKQLRAEPISSLCQRDLIHHVGTFPDTEDQMCNWVPGQRSPDRLDAHVWSFTELMVTNEPTPEELIADAKRRVEIAAQRKLVPEQRVIPEQRTIPQLQQQKKPGWWER